MIVNMINSAFNLNPGFLSLRRYSAVVVGAVVETAAAGQDLAEADCITYYVTV